MVAFFLLSCGGAKRPSLQQVLVSDCFWDRTGDNQVIGGLNSCYRFFSDGRCYYYYYQFRFERQGDSVVRFRKDSAYRYSDGDNIMPDTWKLQGDTLLYIEGVPHKALNVTFDSVLVVEQGTGDTLLLRKNCKTIVHK
jgi:hypothetical protein